MTPGTGKFFTNSNEQPEQEGDIVAELRDWAEIIDRVNDSGTAMVTMISGAVHREAADEIERLLIAKRLTRLSAFVLNATTGKRLQNYSITPILPIHLASSQSPMVPTCLGR